MAVIKKTREDIIEEMITAVILSENMDDMLYNGVKGYKDYTNEELIEEWKNWVGDDNTILEIVEE